MRLIIALFALFLLTGCGSKAPQITAVTPDTPAYSVGAGETHRFSVVVKDLQGLPLNYTWSCTKGTLRSKTGQAVSWTAPYERGTAELQVVVSSGTTSVSYTWAIDVRLNHPPRFISFSPKSTFGGNIGEVFTLTVQAVDDDGDSLTYNWSSSAGKITPENHTASWAAPEIPGSYTVSVKISDGIADRPFTWTFNIEDPVNTIQVNHDLEFPETWVSGKIYVIAKPDFRVNAALTINPGVVVKFHPTAGSKMTVTGPGTVVANGTAVKPIIFTSYLDDAHGGDSNNDWASSLPASGDWQGIYVNSTTASFNYCKFYYGGGGIIDSTFFIDNSQVQISNSVFAHHRGLESGVVNAELANVGTVITGNTFYANEKPLVINPYFNSLNDSNVFHNPDNPLEKNTYNGIFISSAINILTFNIEWRVTEGPYVIDILQIAPNASLMLYNNVVVKLKESGSIVAQGKITANPLGMVVFTSFRDDSYLDDTNADGDVTKPAPGDWGQIALHADGSLFNNVRFFYGGSVGNSVLNLGSARTAVKNSVFAYNQSAKGAIYASGAPDGTLITGNTFYGNARPITANSTINFDESNNFSNPANPTETNLTNAIFINSSSSANTLSWRETEVPFIIEGDLTVAAESSLTIGDKVTLKFTSGTFLHVFGYLVANGQTRITFTSLSDDSRGGDTNVDGAGPAPGDWGGIVLHPGSSSMFSKCEFYYSGYNNSPALNAEQAKTTTTYNTFAYNYLGISARIYGTIITNNTFFANDKPVEIAANMGLDASNKFVNPADPTLTNKYNGIFVTTSNVNGYISWSEVDVPYVILANTTLTIPAGASLFLADGVVLKFMGGSGILYHGTNLIEAGGMSAFTSYRDDMRVGDTNGDGTLTTPADNDWGGIYNGNTGQFVNRANIYFDSH